MSISEYLLSISSKKIKYGLKRTKELLHACNNPQKKVYSIQVVGTNGKGSVSAMLSSMLEKGGYSVGLFTSPHLVSVNERIRINNDLIENKHIKSFIKKYENSIRLIQPSFFELLTVISIWYFEKQKVDFCILETGLGGRYDSVTACDNAGIIFTPISMDHHSLLGNTISLIATDKSMAINNNTEFVFSSKQNQRVMQILHKRAYLHNLKIICANNEKATIILDYLYGKHQLENAMLVIKCVNYLNNKKTINLNERQITDGLKKTVWFGRFHILQAQPTIIFDVAHNDSSLKSFLESFNSYLEINKFERKYLLCAFENNKKIRSILKNFENKFDYIVCSETNIRDSMPSNKIAKIFRNKDKTKIIKNIDESIGYCIKNTNKSDVLVILGSHFIAPAINTFFKNCFALDNKRLLT